MTLSIYQTETIDTLAALRVENNALRDELAAQIDDNNRLRIHVQRQAEYARQQDDRLDFQRRQIEAMMARPRVETTVPRWLEWLACVVMGAVVVAWGMAITN